MSEPLTVALPSAFLDQVARRVVEILDERAPAAEHPEPWLTVQQAADHLACRPQRIYNLVSQRRLRHVKAGSRVLFRRQWLDEYLEASS